MKQIITLLFGVLFSTTYSYSQTVSVSGNFDTAGATETYTISSSKFSDRLDIINVSGDNILSHQISDGAGLYEKDIIITFLQNTCSTLYSSVTFRYSLNSGTPTTINKWITISPSGSEGLGPLSITQGTTGVHANQFYTFTASGLGVTSYSWSVTGGTISGSSTGATIKVTPSAGSCNVTATATGSDGCGNSTSPKTSSRTISAPVYVGTISGNESVGCSYGDSSAYNSSAYVPNGSIHEYVWSVTGPFQLGSNGKSQTHVFVNTTNGYGSGNLYVYVKNTCGQTITKSKYIKVGLGFPGGCSSRSSSNWVDVKETKVVSNRSELKLIVPNFEEKGIQIYIYNLRGGIIEKIQPTSLEVQLDRSKFKDGIYIVKTISKKEMSTSKFKVSD
jgi:hypothetical protein